MISVDELETFFNSAQLPSRVQLNACTVITDVPKMIDSHIATLRANPKKMSFLPYYQRLAALKNILHGNQV